MNGVQYKIGDKVIYDNNGVCYIEDICEHSFSYGTPPRLYYILRSASGNKSTFYVPTESVSLTDKMRPLLSKNEINDILDTLKNNYIGWIDDRKERAETFKRMMTSGDCATMLLLIECIYRKKTELVSVKKRMYSAEEAMLSSAEKLINDEFSHSLEIPSDTVGTYIRSRLGLPEQLNA